MSAEPRLPETISTPRLQLRVPTEQDAEPLNHAIRSSFTELSQWMPWAVEPQTLDESRNFCSEARERWRVDGAYGLVMVLPDSGAIVGGTGFPRLDWEVPSFEIGYWCRTSHTGQGYVTEATRALAELAFGACQAARVELRMDDRNERSWRVAERLGFRLEGVLRSESRDNRGGLRDTRVYALTSREALGLSVAWADGKPPR